MNKINIFQIKLLKARSNHQLSRKLNDSTANAEISDRFKTKAVGINIS